MESQDTGVQRLVDLGQALREVVVCLPVIVVDQRRPLIRAR